MANVIEMTFNTVDWETRYLLQSIHNELQRLRTISESGGEDDSIDAANDFIELSGLYERLSESATSIFGQQITNFSNESV